VPFCPKCTFEYIPSVTHCPEGGERLVEALPSEHQDSVDEAGFEQVLLCRIAGEPHASLLRGALTAAGIPSRALAEVSTAWGIAGLGSRVNAAIRIYVNKRDLPRAAAVYRDHEARRES